MQMESFDTEKKGRKRRTAVECQHEYDVYLSKNYYRFELGAGMRSRSCAEQQKIELRCEKKFITSRDNRKRKSRSRETGHGIRYDYERDESGEGTSASIGRAASRKSRSLRCHTSKSTIGAFWHDDDATRRKFGRWKTADMTRVHCYCDK